MIQYLHKKGLASKAIHADMVATLETDASSYAMAKWWVAKFKHGRDSLEDDPHSGRPVTVVTPKIKSMIWLWVTAHISVIAMAAINECGFELIQYPRYLPDLAPSDLFIPKVENGHFWYQF